MPALGREVASAQDLRRPAGPSCLTWLWESQVRLGHLVPCFAHSKCSFMHVLSATALQVSTCTLVNIGQVLHCRHGETKAALGHPPRA